MSKRKNNNKKNNYHKDKYNNKTNNNHNASVKEFVHNVNRKIKIKMNSSHASAEEIDLIAQEIFGSESDYGSVPKN